ncbi:MAG: M15 family metallopeptidase [Alphaproteobacteria bacterium]|nr:M15 family metallopeptidase [Alphaproteobacteria bacterium]
MSHAAPHSIHIKANTHGLPYGFIYLEDVAPTIIQDISYAKFHNFIGRPLEGYEAERCIVSIPLGNALAGAQEEILNQGMTLKVYEAYRPLRAAQDIVKWAMDINDQKMKAAFYPAIDKSKVFELGFIAIRSQHTRGAAVDLTLVPLPVPSQDTYQPRNDLKDPQLAKALQFNDNSIEMGTRFDYFDELSHTMNPNVSAEAHYNRIRLKDLMAKHGFINYEKEWWHYCLQDEPFPDTYFDFPIR